MRLLALFILLVSSLSFAQGYPAKVVRVIVPHPPGGPGDVPPRGIAQALSQSLGQPFVIENREGADGLIGADAAAKAAPDGYTLCATSAGVIVINPMVRKDANYSATRFAPIVETGTLTQLILANPSVPANSMKELFALAKAKPESVTVGTFGGINLASLLVDWARAELGVRLYPIPFKSASQGLQSAIAGDVQIVTFAMGPALKLVQTGKLKALAVSPRASPALPGVPGIRDSGIGFTFNAWWGWFAPAGTPHDIVQRLNTEIAKLVADPGFNAKYIASQGLISDSATGAPPEAFDKYIKAELAEFERLMKITGLQRQ